MCIVDRGRKQNLNMYRRSWRTTTASQRIPGPFESFLEGCPLDIMFGGGILQNSDNCFKLADRSGILS